MGIVGNDRQIVVHVALTQQMHQPHHLREGDVAIVVALDEEDRRLPLVDGRDRRRLERDVLRVERVAPEVHAREIGAGDEHVGVAREGLRREVATI